MDAAEAGGVWVEYVVGVLIVAALVGAVIWNHKNRDAALAGVEFSSPAAPADVASAIQASYCGGAKSKAKTLISGVTVTPLAQSAFHLETKIGDVGRIEVRPGQGSGSVVRASASDLYIGASPKARHLNSNSWYMRAGGALAHAIFSVLGMAPNAARMKRFQRGLEGRLAKQLRKSSIH